MSFGVTLQLVGTILGIISLLLLFWGGMVAPKGDNIYKYIQNTIINIPRELYTSTQSIKYPALNDKTSISLDGLGQMQVRPGATSSSIVLWANVVPQTTQYEKTPEMKKAAFKTMEGVKGSIAFEFNISNSQVHEIHVANRKFMVRLVEIKNINSSGTIEEEKISFPAHEYIFNIKEIE